MELKMYHIDYPESLGMRRELNEAGLKPMGSVVAKVEDEKGRTYDLYERNQVRTLTLEDSSADLLLWRDGLKENAHSKSLLADLESVLRQRVLEKSSADTWLTSDNLYFNHEYPMDEMQKPSELYRLGLKGIDKVGGYINNDKYSPLYSPKSAILLEVQTATKRELTYWLEGLLACEELTSDQLELVEEIKEQLNQKATKPKRGKKVEKEAEESEANWTQLKKDLTQSPQDFYVASIVGSGIFSHDEVLELSILNLEGQTMYHQYFQPSSKGLIQLRNELSEKTVLWTCEYELIKGLLESKKILIHNPEYDLKMIQQTCVNYGLEELKIDLIDLKSTIKHLTGFSSLEGALDQHFWKVDKSQLVKDAHLSGLTVLSMIHPEAKIFQMDGCVGF